MLNIARRFMTSTVNKLTINPNTIKIGWIGIGIMGQSMCGHLMNAGYKAVIYNRTKSKCDLLRSKGAEVVDTPIEVAQKSDVIFSMVGFPSDVRDITVGENGIINSVKPGSIYIDMTTSQPSLAQEISEKLAEKNVSSLDAPVSGGDVGAREAKLSIMVGGEEDIYKKTLPLFQLMGTNINYMGKSGSGQHTKMVNQILISTMMVGVCEGLIYGYKAGLNLNDVIKAVGSGAAGSWTINNLGPRMLNRNFDPGFFVVHFIKDLGIALDESRRMNIELPGLNLAHKLYKELEEQGHGKSGTQALLLALEKMNHIDEGVH